MADFCKQCSAKYLGMDTNDMAGISTPENTADGLYASVLCEGCGMTQVDHEGTCVSPICLEEHGLKNGQFLKCPDCATLIRVNVDKDPSLECTNCDYKF